MKEWENIFENVYSKSKNIFEDTKALLYKVAIFVSLIGTILVAISMFDLQSQGANFSQSLSPSDTQYKDSLYILIFDIFFIILNIVLNLILSVFFFFKITRNEKSISESFKYFISKFIPLFLTWVVFLILIIPLFILLIIPGIIFTFMWIFSTYCVLFRNKNYYSALSYSKSLISGRKLETLNSFVACFLRMWKYWVLSIVLFLIVILIENNYIYLIGNFIGNVFLIILGFFWIIFLINYFLDIEKRNGISNELDENKPDLSSEGNSQDRNKISQTEINAKNYIETYKSQYSKNSVKMGLIKSNISEEDAEKYLDKYM